MCIYIVDDSFALILGTIARGTALVIFPDVRFPKLIVGLEILSFSFYLIHKFVIAVVHKILTYFLAGKELENCRS